MAGLDLNGVVDLMIAGEEEDREAAVYSLAEFIADSDDHQVVIREDCPRIFDALAMICVEGTDRAKQYACLAISMLCSDSENQTLLSGTEGLLESLVDLSLDETLSDSCRTNVAWAIGALANDNPAVRKSFGEIVGSFAGLVMIACTLHEESRERAAFAMAEVARDCLENQLGIGQTDGALEALVHMCATGSESSKEQAAWALAMLVEGCQTNAELTLATPFALEAMVDMCAHGSETGRANAVFAIAELARSGPMGRAAVLDTEGAVDALQAVADGDESCGRQVAQWALEHLAGLGDGDMPEFEEVAAAAGAADGEEVSAS